MRCLCQTRQVLLISGVFAIFSTSTNLIAQGLLLSHGLPGFGAMGGRDDPHRGRALQHSGFWLCPRDPELGSISSFQGLGFLV